VRRFALKCLEAGAPWVVAAAAAPDPALVAGRAKGGGTDLRLKLLPGLLERAKGKGGGSPDLLQVAAADAPSVAEAFRWASDALPAALAGGGS
jgi:hypothetical protein